MSLALIEFFSNKDLEKLILDEGLLDTTRKAAENELELRKTKKL